ncbi:MAG: outer membrane lipoprotein-sorting protein [Balneolaceae bacterium]
MMKSLSVLAIFSFSLPLLLSAQERITDTDRARSVFEEVEERRASISTEQTDMEMVITNSSGNTRTRSMVLYNRFEGDDSESLILFSAPANVAGTGFLTINEGDDRLQRLYLPSVGRVQTITSSQRGDRFMGSDFTYEDLGNQQADDYEFEWMETHDAFYLIRARALDSNQYTHVEFEIDRERYTLLQIRYYADSEEPIKRLEAEDFEQITDRLWSPKTMTMYDLRNDRFTTITWTNREINGSIPDWRFTERGLRRGL